MNLQGFLDSFRYVVEAPNGVKQLRELIYFLGITGGLCPQYSADGDGVSLLEEIQKERKARIERGLFKRSPRLETHAGTYDDHRPKIPESWVWTRLVDIGEISPKNVYQDETIGSFASMSAISEMHGIPIQGEDRPWQDIKKGYTHVSDGDVVVAKITPCFENGKAAAVKGLTNGFGAGTTELHVVRPLPGVHSEFIYLFLRSPYFKANGIRHMTGTAGQKRLPSEYFATLPFPLPPRAEQQRIVAKVDELMALCDKLERQQQERERQFGLVSVRCNYILANALTPQSPFQCIRELEHLDPDLTRQTILSLVIGSHSESSEGARRRIPFGDLLDGVSVNGVSKGPTEDPKGTEVLRISAGTSRDDYLVSEMDFKHVHLTSQEIKKFRLEPNDLLACRYNGNLRFVGRFSLYRGSTKKVQVNPDKLIRFRVDVRHHDPRYICFAMNTQATRSLIEGMCTTTAGNIGISASKLKAIVIPVPELMEQRRIVTRIEELFLLVELLKRKQLEKSKIASAFAQAAITAITGSADQENKPMKAPNTELVTCLKLDRVGKPNPGGTEPLAALLAEHVDGLSAKALWQRSGLAIDAFYQQLKMEMAQGWIVEPEPAAMREVAAV